MYKLYLFCIASLIIFSIYVHKLNHDNEILHNIRTRTLQKQEIEKLRLRRAIESEDLTGWAWLKNKWRTLGDKLTLSQLPYDCNAILFERLNNKCCKLPELIPPAVFENCTVRNVSLSFRRRYNSYRRGPMCLYSCVFSELHWLEPNEEEELDLLAITTSFSQAVDDTWRKLVRDAIISCNEVLNENVTVSVLLTSFGQTCTVAPLLFMKCIKKTLILSCPASVVKTTDEDCPKDMERLRGCNPFHLMHQNSSSAQLLLRRPETTPPTTPYRPPPMLQNNNMPSPWSRVPGPPHAESVVWHNKNGNSDELTTTPMHDDGGENLKSTEKNMNVERKNPHDSKLHYLSTKSMQHGHINNNHGTDNNNNHGTDHNNHDKDHNNHGTDHSNNNNSHDKDHNNHGTDHSNNNNNHGTNHNNHDKDHNNHGTDHSNNKHGKDHIIKTTKFDEWKGVTDKIDKHTRDIEDTTPRGAAASHWRDKFIPKFSNS